MVEAGRTLRGLHSNPVRESFLTNAAWEAHGCLMACLGGSLPHRYFFFLLEADFSDTPMNVTAEQAVVLRNDCLDLPAYGQEIEATLRIIETGLPR
jgi:hypothetical protein